MAKKAVTAVKIEPKKLTKLDLGMALFSMAELGVKTIGITYSGGGDSGSIEECNPRDKKDALIDESELDRWSEIQAMLEEWAYKRLQDTEGDWINNEGGSGTFTIQVPSGDYKLDHSINVQEDYDYSGKISEEME
jgi:hypothetical protein